MNDREKWWERVRDIRACGTTWWWYIYIYPSLVKRFNATTWKKRHSWMSFSIRSWNTKKREKAKNKNKNSSWAEQYKNWEHNYLSSYYFYWKFHDAHSDLIIRQELSRGEKALSQTCKKTKELAEKKKQNETKQNNFWLGLVSLVNGISTLFRLFNAKAILLEEQ